MANQIDSKVTFFLNGVSKSENRDGSVDRKGTSVLYNFVDNKKKNMKENDYTPVSYAYLSLIDMQDIGLQFGKKYKIIFEEVK